MSPSAALRDAVGSIPRGQPVYFVQDRWYDDVYAPQVRSQGHGDGDHPGKGKNKGKGHN